MAISGRDGLFRLSIERLEGNEWGELRSGSPTVAAIAAIRKKPLKLITDEELRLVVSHHIAFPWTMALAVERLRENPFRSGFFGKGDLLIELLNLPAEVWKDHPERAMQVRRLGALAMTSRHANDALRAAYRQSAGGR